MKKIQVYVAITDVSKIKEQKLVESKWIEKYIPGQNCVHIQLTEISYDIGLQKIKLYFNLTKINVSLGGWSFYGGISH